MQTKLLRHEEMNLADTNYWETCCEHKRLLKHKDHADAIPLVSSSGNLALPVLSVFAPLHWACESIDSELRKIIELEGSFCLW